MRGADRPPDELIEVFTTEADAREAFRQRRLQTGPASGGATLVSFDEGFVRPLCWFASAARPGDDPRVQRRRRAGPLRWVGGLVAVALAAALWALVDGADEAGAAVAPLVSRTALVTGTVDGAGRAVPSDERMSAPQSTSPSTTAPLRRRGSVRSSSSTESGR